MTDSSEHSMAAIDGWVADGMHHYLMRVHYEDTDVGGIVYHANYIAFAERARSSYLRTVGIYQEEYVDRMRSGDDGGFAFVVRRIEIDYREAAGLGTALRVTSELLKIGGASMKIEQTVINHENGHILARLIVDIVSVRFDADGNARPQRVSSEIREKLLADAAGDA